MIAVALLPPVSLLGRGYETRGDVHHYESIAGRLTAGGIPYRDFDFEYPPLALVPIAIPALTDEYQRAFRLVMLAVAATGIVLVAHLIARIGGGRLRLFASCAAVALAPLALPVVFFDRLDAWPSVLLLAALTALAAERRMLSAGLLAAATLAKVYPAVALPAVVLVGRKERRVPAREAALFAVLVSGALLLFVAVGYSGAAQAASTLLRRPLHIESLGGSGLLVLYQLGVYDPTVYVSFGGSQDLHGVAPAVVAFVQGVLMASLLCVVWVAFARRQRSFERALTATTASVVVLVAFGKVLSPQFLVWIVFLVPLVERRALIGASLLSLAALALTRLYFPYRYEELILLGGVAWIAALRNVVLVVLALYLLRTLERPVDGLIAIPGQPQGVPASDRT